MNDLKMLIKTSYPIQIGLNNPILRKISKPIPLKYIKSPKNQEFSEILLNAMKIYDGIGLAAPQIGVNKRMIAICQLDKNEKDIIKTEVLINPEIIQKSGTYISEESCLSLPGLRGKVKRFKKITVKYYNIKGEKKVIIAQNLNAVIIQHEIDHLDGILYLDKVINKQIDIKKII